MVQGKLTYSHESGLKKLLESGRLQVIVPEVVLWHEVQQHGQTADVLSLPSGTLELIFSKLSTKALLQCRQTCRLWRSAVNPFIERAAVSMKQQHKYLPKLAHQLKNAFGNIKTLVLTTLSTAAKADPELSLKLIANYLSALRTLRHLVLLNLPVRAVSSPMSASASGTSSSSSANSIHPWGLGCLACLRLVSLDASFSTAESAGDASSKRVGQAQILQTVSQLTGLKHLSLKLLELAPEVDLDLDLADDVDDYHEIQADQVPDPAWLVALTNLQSLEAQNCIVKDAGLTIITTTLVHLRKLDLQGHVSMSEHSIQAMSRLMHLTQLGLSKVHLLFSEDDPDMCTVQLLKGMFEALQQLQGFAGLRFELGALDSTCYIHSAYLLQLYETPLDQLQSLDLGCVIFDSDYSFCILAALTTLTSLRLTYNTWPLSLHPSDMSILAPLTCLQRFHFKCVEDEETSLLSLTTEVIDALAAAWTSCRSFHFSGHISLSHPCVSSLSSWSSLTDLSLLHKHDPSLLHYPPSPSAAASPPAAPLLQMDLPASLPTSLERLALGAVAVSVADLMILGSRLTALEHLQITDCDITAEHLMVRDFGMTNLELLIMHDSRPACQPEPGMMHGDVTAATGGLESSASSPAPETTCWSHANVDTATPAGLRHWNVIRHAMDWWHAANANKPILHRTSSASNAKYFLSQQARLYQAVTCVLSSIGRLSQLEYLMLGLNMGCLGVLASTVDTEAASVLHSYDLEECAHDGAFDSSFDHAQNMRSDVALCNGYQDDEDMGRLQAQLANIKAIANGPVDAAALLELRNLSFLRALTIQARTSIWGPDVLQGLDALHSLRSLHLLPAEWDSSAEMPGAASDVGCAKANNGRAVLKPLLHALPHMDA